MQKKKFRRVYEYKDLAQLSSIRHKYDDSKNLINFTVYFDGEPPKHYKNYFFFSHDAHDTPLCIGFIKNINNFTKSDIDFRGEKVVVMPVNGKNYIEWEYVNE